MRNVHGTFFDGLRGNDAIFPCDNGVVARTSEPSRTTPSRSIATIFAICTSVLTSTFNWTQLFSHQVGVIYLGPSQGVNYLGYYPPHFYNSLTFSLNRKVL